MTWAEVRIGRIRSGHSPVATGSGPGQNLPCLAAFLASLLVSGCGAKPAPAPRAVASMARLEVCHPDISRLTEWDRFLAAAQREAAPALISAGVPELQMAALAPLVGLPAADPDAGLEKHSTQARADVSRGEAILIEEATDEYLDDLQRLRLQVLANAEPEEVVDLVAYGRQVQRVGEELAALETQLHALRPNPTSDRFFFTPEQIRERRSLFDRIERDLADLRERRGGELAALLVPGAKELANVTQTDLDAIQNRRDARIARAIADLRRVEKEESTLIADLPPWPAVPSAGALALAPGVTEVSTFGEVLQRAANNSAREALEQSRQLQQALTATRKESSQLRLRIRDEVGALARNFARDWGYDLGFAPGRQGPDLTSRLASKLTEYFHRSGDRRPVGSAPTSARVR